MYLKILEKLSSNDQGPLPYMRVVYQGTCICWHASTEGNVLYDFLDSHFRRNSKQTLTLILLKVYQPCVLQGSFFPQVDHNHIFPVKQ